MLPKAASHLAESKAQTPSPTSSDSNAHLNAIVLKRALAAYEQAAFLWTSRRSVARSSAVTLDGLARFDDRLSRLVYKLGERSALAKQFLMHDRTAFKAGETFVTTIVALRGGVTSVFDELLGRLESDPVLLSPLSSALAWLEYRDVRPYLNRIHTASSPALACLGIVAAVAHGADPGAALDYALESDDPMLQATALEAVGRLALRDRLPKATALLRAQHGMSRFWAAWSSVRLGEREGLPILGRIIADGGPYCGPACEMGLRALDLDQAIRAHQRLATGKNPQLAVTAAGIIGDPRFATFLLDAMESPEQARRAGASFSLLTGSDLRRSDLDAQHPAAVVTQESVLNVTAQPDAKIETLAAPEPFDDEPEEDLVWPDVVRIRRWWDGTRQTFSQGVRYIAGRPIRFSEMTQVLETGNQHQRAAAALELALLDPSKILLDVTAPAHRQGIAV